MSVAAQGDCPSVAAAGWVVAPDPYYSRAITAFMVLLNESLHYVVPLRAYATLRTTQTKGTVLGSHVRYFGSGAIFDPRT
jgi:hypothetical protein